MTSSIYTKWLMNSKSDSEIQEMYEVLDLSENSEKIFEYFKDAYEVIYEISLDEFLESDFEEIMSMIVTSVTLEKLRRENKIILKGEDECGEFIYTLNKTLQA